jgi:inosine-uridine nucleoside N-ribohydrolase
VLRVILDVDTGVDDALAIALAVCHAEVRLEAVVTVAGNVGLELTTHNTLRVLDWLGASDIPVYAGADRPLTGPPREASHWHGADGLGGAQLLDSTRSARPDGVAYLVEHINATPGELTLVCTAPLTNLASAVRREPAIVQKVKSVVVMGGAARPPGNATPVAEFNVYADPEAAAIVFEQAWPLTMVGLDVTNQVRLTRAERLAISSVTSAEARLVYEVTRQLFDVRGVEAIALHDPLALLVALQPDLVTCVRSDVHVETAGTYTRGQTVVDLRPSAPPARLETNVCIEVDVDRSRELFFRTLGLAECAPTSRSS